MDPILSCFVISFDTNAAKKAGESDNYRNWNAKIGKSDLKSIDLHACITINAWLFLYHAVFHFAWLFRYRWSLVLIIALICRARDKFPSAHTLSYLRMSLIILIVYTKSKTEHIYFYFVCNAYLYTLEYLRRCFIFKRKCKKIWERTLNSTIEFNSLV